MRGASNIVRMRQQGYKPSLVFVEMLPMQQWARQLTEKRARHVDIHLRPAEIAGIETADLRCLRGLNVMVNGPDDSTTERVARACQRAGARTVQAFFFDLSKPEPHWITRALRLAEEGETAVCN